MKENAQLLAVGKAFEGVLTGTPAGNSRLTQEQYDWLRQCGILEEHIRCVYLLMPRWQMELKIPEGMRAATRFIQMPCPVVGHDLILMPDGQVARHEGARPTLP